MSGQKKEEGCVFCNRLNCDEQEHFVLHRGNHWYLILNLYPYNNGHILLVLNRHDAMISSLNTGEIEEMGHLMQIMEKSLLEAYQPDGVNCGYNGGASAGAGIPEHLHLHMLPRWAGDTNFMSTIGQTRIMPQTLEQSYSLLKPVVDRIVGQV